jgi:hypothetical protein
MTTGGKCLRIVALFCSKLSFCILLYDYPADHQATGGKIMDLHTCRKKLNHRQLAAK